MSNRYLRDLDSFNNQQLNGITENAVFPEHLDEFEYKPRTLIDETLEIIDPTPNVHTMFTQFNEKFFWNKLAAVQVRWSNRMTTCAGTCTFHPRNRECVISLSLPLLKLRPRKDLVETLLHEMIHGFLFVTNNNRDRDGHGPEFCKHMERINREAGTKITIYHNFHEEVRLYQQHWWRCDGPCQKRAPYFGIVRRAMNRAPGPSDFWWKTHQQNCGGQFKKIQEPENKKPSNSKKSSEVSKPLPKQNTLDNFVQSTKTSSTSTSPSFSNDPPKSKSGGIKTISKGTNSMGSKTVTVNKVDSGSPNTSASEGIKKLGNSTNNVFGFGTGGPGSSSSTPSSFVTPKPSRNRVNSSGVLGGSNTGKSILLTRFMSPQPTKSNAQQTKPDTPPEQNPQQNEIEHNNAPECPICNKIIIDENINRHIDSCLASNDTNTAEPVPKRPRIKQEPTHECPFCQQKFSASLIDIHVNDCLNLDATIDDNARPGRSQTSDDLKPRNSSTTSRNNRINCPKCSQHFTADKINDHLDICLNETGDFATSNNSIINLTNDLDDVMDLTLSPIKPATGKEECITCGRNINVKDYSIHTEECLKKHREQLERDLGDVFVDGICSRPGSSKSKKNSSTYECLVCSSRISKEIPLNEHLETCTSSTYGDMTLNTSAINPPDEDIVNMEYKYPCPICNLMIIGKDMAEHVDWCVTRKK